MHTVSRVSAAVAAATFAVALAWDLRPAAAYPLDGYDTTGIPRLLYQRWVQEGELKGRKRPGSGELMPLAMVDLRLLEQRAETVRSLASLRPGLTPGP